MAPAGDGALRRQHTETPDDGAEAHRLLADVRQQEAATREVLEALGRARSDPSEILDTIIDRAGDLCRAQASQLYLLDGVGVPVVPRLRGRARRVPPLPRGPPGGPGQGEPARSGGRGPATQQIVDVLADPSYGRHDLQHLAGFRSLMSAPMLLDGEVVGYPVGLAHRGPPVRRGARSALLSTFAAQAAIVVRQVELVAGPRGAQRRARGQGASSSRCCGRSATPSAPRLDLDEVLAQIVSGAVRLTGADGGSIMEYDVRRRLLPRPGDGRRQTRTSPNGCGRSSILRGTPRRSAGGRRAHDAGGAPTSAAVERDEHLDAPARRRVAVAARGAARAAGPSWWGPWSSGAGRAGDFGERDARAAPHLRQPVRPRDRQRAALRRARHQARRARGRQPPQVGVPREHVARAADAAQRGHRLLRGAPRPDVRRPQRAPGGVPPRHLDVRAAPARAAQRDPRPVQGRGRPDGPRADPRSRCAPALDYVLSLVRERAAAHAHRRWGWRWPTSVGIVWADELRLKQVVLNLVSNAVKFTPDGGRVDVVGHAGRTTTSWSRVTDTGVGVPPEDRERIFESFQQGHRGAPKEEGTGLGLTLSRRIVELFGGTLCARAAGRRGQHLRLPAAAAAIEPPVAVDDASGRATRAARRRRPRVPRPDDGLPVGVARAGRCGRGTASRRSSLARTACAGGGRARHPAAAHGRVGGADPAQGRPGHERHPGRGGLDRRRAPARPRSSARRRTSSSRCAATTCSTPCACRGSTPWPSGWSL